MRRITQRKRAPRECALGCSHAPLPASTLTSPHHPTLITLQPSPPSPPPIKRFDTPASSLLPHLIVSPLLPLCQVSLPTPGATDTAAPTVLSRGLVVVRVINIGREPRDTSRQPYVSVCMCVCVRAHPLTPKWVPHAHLPNLCSPTHERNCICRPMLTSMAYR